jgi:hypothetical protein
VPSCSPFPKCEQPIRRPAPSPPRLPSTAQRRSSTTPSARVTPPTKLHKHSRFSSSAGSAPASRPEPRLLTSFSTPATKQRSGVSCRLRAALESARQAGTLVDRSSPQHAPRSPRDISPVEGQRQPTRISRSRRTHSYRDRRASSSSISQGRPVSSFHKKPVPASSVTFLTLQDLTAIRLSQAHSLQPQNLSLRHGVCATLSFSLPLRRSTSFVVEPRRFSICWANTSVSPGRRSHTGPRPSSNSLTLSSLPRPLPSSIAAPLCSGHPYFGLSSVEALHTRHP